MAYQLQPSTFNLSPKAYHRQGGSGKLLPRIIFFQFKFLEPARPSLLLVELPGTILGMKFCIEWCGVQGLKSLDTSKF